LEYDCVLEIHLTAHNSLIQDISSDIRQYYRRIRNSCTFVC